MSFKKKFFTSISGYALYTYISQGLEFFSTIILSRLLLPEEYGFAAIIGIFSGFIQLFSNAGIGVAVVRSDYGQTFQRHLHSLSVYIGVFLAIVLGLSSFPISYLFDNKDLVVPTMVISLRFIFDSVVYVPYSVLSKRLQFKMVGLVKLSGVIFQISLTIILAYLGFSYWSIIIPMTLNPIIQYIFIYKKVEFRFKLYSFRAARRVFMKIRVLMGSLTLNNLIYYWAGNADKLIVGKFYSTVDLGLYNRAFRFIMLSSRLVTSIFSGVLLPSLKKLIADKGDVGKEYVDILRIITLFNMPVIAVLLILPRQLVLLLWGNDWIGVANFLPYIGIILIFHPIQSTMQSLFMLYEKEKKYLYINTFLTISSVISVSIGAIFSIIHIMFLLSLSIMVIDLTVIIYFGLIRTFHFKFASMIRFMFTFLIAGLSLLASVYLDNLILIISTLLIFNLFLLFDLRFTIKQFLLIIFAVIRNYFVKKV